MIDHFFTLVQQCNTYLQLPWTPSYTWKLEAGKIDAVNYDDDASFFLIWSFSLIIIFTLIVCLFEIYLQWRQLFILKWQKNAGNDALSIELETHAMQLDAEKKKKVAKKTRKNGGQEEKKNEEMLNKSLSSEEGDNNDNDGINTKSKEDNKELEGKLMLPRLKGKSESNYQYSRSSAFYKMGTTVYVCAFDVFFMATADMAGCWDISHDVGKSLFGWNEEENEVYISVIFLFLFQILFIWCLEMPIHYTKYRIDNTYFGTSKDHGSTITEFFKSRSLVLFVDTYTYCTYAAILVLSFRYVGDHHLYVWGIMVSMSIQESVVSPIMNFISSQKKELPEGNLKKDIEALATKISFPLENILVAHNDYDSFVTVVGFIGVPKVVGLNLQLVEDLEEKEALALVGQELAKWKVGYVWKKLAVTQVINAVSVYLYSHFYQRMEFFISFGFDDLDRLPIPIIIQMLLFIQTIYIPLGKILIFFKTMMEQYLIFSSDEYYCTNMSVGKNNDCTRQFQSGLCKLQLFQDGNTMDSFDESFANPDSWYSSCYFSQPLLVQRLSNISRLEKKTK